MEEVVRDRQRRHRRPAPQVGRKPEQYFDPHRRRKSQQAFAGCLTFRKLTRKHFDEEAEILREAEFPRLKSHLREHGIFIGKIEEAFSGCGSICKESDPCPCLENLSFCTLDHIVRNDLDFKSHLQTRNLADGGS